MECTSDKYLNYYFTLQFISTAVPVIAGFMVRRYLPSWQKVLFAYVTAIFLIEFGANVLIHYGRSNAWLYDIAPLVEYALLTYALSMLITSHKLRNVLRASIIVYSGFWFASTYLKSPIIRSSGFLFSISYLLLLVMSLASLLGLIRGKANLLIDARFWFSVTVLFYAAGDLGTCLLSDHLLKSMDLHNIIWATHLALAILVNCLWSGVFICQYRHPSSG